MIEIREDYILRHFSYLKKMDYLAIEILIFYNLIIERIEKNIS